MLFSGGCRPVSTWSGAAATLYIGPDLHNVKRECGTAVNPCYAPGLLRMPHQPGGVVLEAAFGPGAVRHRIVQGVEKAFKGGLTAL